MLDCMDRVMLALETVQLFPKVAVTFCISPTMSESSFAPYPHQYVVLSAFWILTSLIGV